MAVEVSPPSARRAILTYNVARLGLLAACLVLGWVAGLRGLLLFVAALLVSGVLSWFLLARQRAAMALAVEAAVVRKRARAAQRAAAEDAYLDRMAAAEQHVQVTEDVTPLDR